ncbi:hypothetical protein BH11VER1_BH11VER1_10620 [soil metagenome]
MPKENVTSHHDFIERETSWLKLSLLLLVPIFAICFCGSREAWAHGTVAVLIGVCALVSPFRIRIPLPVLIPTLLALILCLGAFLPSSWFAGEEWRIVMRDDYGVPLPSTHSAQPWVSFENWLLVLVGIVWFFICLGAGFSTGRRRFLLQSMVVAIALVSITTIVVHYLKIEVPFWRSIWRVNYYGPFPNRNNFSGVLAIGSVLSMATAFDAYRRKRFSWIFFALAMIPIFSALLLNTSRMGVFMFFGGISVWMLTATMDKRSIQRFAICVSVLLVLVSFFILYGQNILDRFTGNRGILSTLANDGRLHIFGDAFTVLSKNPVWGVGLGNFEPLFAFSKTPGTGYLITRALHPENDWLWFAVETGIPAITAAFIAFLLLMKSFKSTHVERKTSSQKDLRLRQAGAISVGLLAIQGLVDTPLHTIGLTTLGALMAGIALNPKRAVSVTGSLSPFLSRALGVVCIVIGASWIAVAMGKPVIPGTAAGKLYASEAMALSIKGDNAGALDTMNKALAMQPLQWNYYFDRAQIKLRLGLPFQEALNDFAITRFLEPNHADLCIREMEIWLSYAPTLSIPAVREAMRRDRNVAYSYYQTINNYLYAHPELRPAVRDLATDPKLKLIYLSGATGNDFQQVLQDLLNNFPTLQCFTADEKLRLFKLWYANGDKTSLIAKLESSLEWLKVGWPVLAGHHAVNSEFEKACQIALKNLRPPEFITLRKADLAELERSFLHNTTDLVRGLELYQMQKAKGLWDPALLTLRQLAELPNFPHQIHYEQSYILYRKNEYAKAWESMSLYLAKADVLSL